MIDVLDQVELADSRIWRLRRNEGEVHAHVGRRDGLTEADDAHVLRFDDFRERLVELRQPGGIRLQVPDFGRREEQKPEKLKKNLNKTIYSSKIYFSLIFPANNTKKGMFQIC